MTKSATSISTAGRKISHFKCVSIRIETLPLEVSLSQRRSAVLACILLVLYTLHMSSWKVKSADVSYLSHSTESFRMNVYDSEETGHCISLKSQHPMSLVSPSATSDFRADAFSDFLTAEVHHTQLQPGLCPVLFF